MNYLKAHVAHLPQLARDALFSVAIEHGVSIDELLSESRAQDVARARQAFYATLYAMTWPNGSRRFSMPQIARFSRRSDHTTILHGIRAHTKRMQEAA